jgi:hypothetical protein
MAAWASCNVRFDVFTTGVCDLKEHIAMSGAMQAQEW